jgi:hypothetical protein
MSDIVEWLRSLNVSGRSYCSRYNEAADEIERLRVENENLRRWKAMDKPITAAMAVVSNDMQRLKAQHTEAAAFLDRLASFLQALASREGMLGPKADDCRAMAAKLRGEI